MRIETCCTSVEDESLKLNTLTQFSQKDGDLHENPPFVQKVYLTLSLNSNKTFYYKRMSSHSRCSKEEDKILQRRHLQFSTAHWINFALSCWNSKSLSLSLVCVSHYCHENFYYIDIPCSSLLSSRELYSVHEKNVNKFLKLTFCMLIFMENIEQLFPMTWL